VVRVCVCSSNLGRLYQKIYVKFTRVYTTISELTTLPAESPSCVVCLRTLPGPQLSQQLGFFSRFGNRQPTLARWSSTAERPGVVSASLLWVAAMEFLELMFYLVMGLAVISIVTASWLLRR